MVEWFRASTLKDCLIMEWFKASTLKDCLVVELFKAFLRTV